MGFKLGRMSKVERGQIETMSSLGQTAEEISVAINRSVKAITGVLSQELQVEETTTAPAETEAVLV